MRCKSRLAMALPPEARVELARWMLAKAIECASASVEVTHLIVVSAERDEVPTSVEVLWDGGYNLNSALERARDAAFSRGARELVIVHADLPELKSADIDDLVRAGRRCDVAIAPDRMSNGTNALYLRRPQFQFQFGDEGSCRRHEAEALARGLRSTRVERAGLAHDVDTVEDLQRYMPWYAPRRVSFTPVVA
jgi:2-phospho-L-lactate guanylyltransferase